MRVVSLGLLGFGIVNKGFYKALIDQTSVLKSLGYEVEVSLILVRDMKKAKEENPDISHLFVDRAEKIIENPEIDVVVEAINGVEPSATYLYKALKNGKVVISANKAALANHWEALNGVGKDRLFYEASVCGGIPVIDVLKGLTLADDIFKVEGILNGTSNFILTEMASEGISYSTALLKAEALGYAEADPTADVDGIDAANKLAILSNICFGGALNPNLISKESIRNLKDIPKGTKLIAAVEKTEKGIVANVCLKTLSDKDPLFCIDGVLNALIIHSRKIGPLMFTGPGAGSSPTGTAMLLDLFHCINQKKL